MYPSRMVCRSDRRRELPRAVQVLSQRTAQCGSKLRFIRSEIAGRGDCRLDRSALLPNQTGASSNHTLHGTRETLETVSGSPSPDCVRAANRQPVVEAQISTASTSTDLHIRSWSRRGGMGACYRSNGRRHFRANHYPPELATIMAPRLIELCFQTAGLWELGRTSRMGLPQHVREVSLLRTRTSPRAGYRVVAPQPGPSEVSMLKSWTQREIATCASPVPDRSASRRCGHCRLKSLQAVMSGEAFTVA